MEKIELIHECTLCASTKLTCRMYLHNDGEGNVKYSLGLYLIGVLHGQLLFNGNYETLYNHYKNVEVLC